MVKYIECEAAYRFAQDQLKKETGAYSKGWNHALGVMKSALHNNDALPAADVVPVVRCGECKHWKRIRNDCILASCELDALVQSEDFFCADGERKDGDVE